MANKNVKITIAKLAVKKEGRPLYRVMKISNSMRLSLMDSDYELDEIKTIINSFPTTYNYEVIR